MHQNLIKLLIANKGRGFFKAEKTTANNEATIYLYDVIVNDDWFGGITPIAFMKELASIDAETIHLRICSPGGDVFAARAMQQAIREHSAKFIAHIDGLCASAATFLPMVSDESVIAPGSIFMIHKAWTIVLGNSDALYKAADVLKKIDGSISNDYAKKTGKDEAQIIDWMAAETYFMDQEAVDNGFIDRIAEGASAKNQISWDLSAYSNAPELNNKQSLVDTDKKDENADESRSIQIENHYKNRPTYLELMPV